MSDIEILQGWGSFDAAVYKFVHECAEGDDLTRPVPAMLTPSLPTWRRR
jgi:hypothetical protein